MVSEEVLGPLYPFSTESLRDLREVPMKTENYMIF